MNFKLIFFAVTIVISLPVYGSAATDINANAAASQMHQNLTDKSPFYISFRQKLFVPLIILGPSKETSSESMVKNPQLIPCKVYGTIPCLFQVNISHLEDPQNVEKVFDAIESGTALCQQGCANTSAILKGLPKEQLTLIARPTKESTESDQKKSNENAQSTTLAEDKPILGTYSLFFRSKPQGMNVLGDVYSLIPNPKMPECVGDPIAKTCIFIASVTNPDTKKIFNTIKDGSLTCQNKECKNVSAILQDLSESEIDFCLVSSDSGTDE